LRIENTDKSKPEPINIVDLDANKLTIIYPHNSTFVHVDLNKTAAATGRATNAAGFSNSAEHEHFARLRSA